MYDERFARQYRYEPPSECPMSLPFSSIVHHLSGPNRYALTQIYRKRSIGRWCPLRFPPQPKQLWAFTFITHQGFPPKYSHIC